jgi:hypothetical protein
MSEVIEAVATKLATDEAVLLRRRAHVGDRCIALAFDGPWSALDKIEEDERETYARDAISNILTALYGPAGITREVEESESSAFSHTGWKIELYGEVERKANALLDSAFRSYQGDAEDYNIELKDES